MRSWRERGRSRSRGVLLGALLAVAACGNDTRIAEEAPDAGGGAGSGSAVACGSSFLDYNNFGAPFVLDWCTGCHSSTLRAGMRQGAPVGVNLDTLAEIRERAAAIIVRTSSATPTMPPAGGPSGEERTLMAEWLTCGAP